ncbi:unnamed protein product [Adineta ricciae]|uniref:Uncharacterized protein n=1 Tax=Adineta ricciae TaxID=249248 RepID=A0A814AXY1_ADIRI|nr:unnamed protein product [Adineta ricciae]
MAVLLLSNQLICNSSKFIKQINTDDRNITSAINIFEHRYKRTTDLGLKRSFFLVFALWYLSATIITIAMPPEQMATDLEAQPRSEICTEEEDTEDDDASLSPPNTKKSKQRRISHSEIERRRREKMNRYIDEIAQLLPIDAAKKLDKLTVLKVAVETIKYLKGTTSKVLSAGFGKQVYLNDDELLQLTLATIDQVGTSFFLIIECQKGRICYASSSTESILGYKSTELCSQTIFDLVYPNDLELIKQQLLNEKKATSTSTGESLNDSKTVRLITTKQNCLEIGNRRSFSCRIVSKLKRTNRKASTQSTNNYITIDFVGYIKQFSPTNENQTESKTRPDRQHSNANLLTPSDVFHAIGNAPVSCLLTMAHVSNTLDQSSPNSSDNVHVIDRMFSCKLNPDGQFTYFDQICYPLLGYTTQDLLGMNFSSLIHEDDRNKVADIWNRVCRDRQIITSGNYRFRTKNNLYITLQTVFEPFVNPWNDELEVIVTRNKTKMKSVRLHNNPSILENPRSVDISSPSSMDSTELIRQLFPPKLNVMILFTNDIFNIL